MEKHPNNIHWYCNICEKGAGKLVLAINKLSRRQDDLEQTVCKNTERLDAAEGKLGEHGDKIAEIENSLRAHTDLIAQAQADAQRDGSASTVATGTNQEQVIMSEVTKTVNERLERQKNIIFFNAPEANSNLKDEVMKADMTYVKELCRYLCGEDLHYSVKRLGKRVKKIVTQKQIIKVGQGTDQQVGMGVAQMTVDKIMKMERLKVRVPGKKHGNLDPC